MEHTAWNMKHGFSLMEILLAIGILTIITAVSLPTFFGYQASIEADEEIGKIRSTLRDAQGRAIAVQENSKWGVRFTHPASGSELYQLFSGPTYAGGTVWETIYLSPRLTFTAPPSGTSTDVIFNKRNGNSASTTDIVITVRARNRSDIIESITVSPKGNIQ